ncbi:hypothetical protein Tco_0357010 [Tanacetum coccineum]
MIKEKRGEYDLWSMKMRQYIAITDHILWDIITNGDQATTDPASSSAPKTSLAFQPQEETMRQKPLTNCYLQDTYRHLLIFMMPQMQNLTGTAIKSKNFAMSIATMMSGQPVLDVLEFDDLYTNNLTRCKLLLTVHSHSDEPSYDPSLLVQASMHTTLDDRRIFCMQNMSTLDKMDLVICATGATKLRYTSVLKLDGYKPEISDSILEEKQKEQDPSLKKKRDELQDKLEKGFGVESSSSMDSENTSRNTNSSESSNRELAIRNKGNPEEDLKDYAIIDSGCSGSMTGDKDKLSDFKEFKGGYSHSNVRSSLTRSVLIHLQSLSLFCSDEDLVTTRAPIKNDVYSLESKEYYSLYSDDDIPKDGVFSTNSFDDENTDTEEGGVADYHNMDPTMDVTSTPTLRIHKIHPQSQIIGKKEPKKVSQALADESWVEAMQEELLQFKLQDVWVLCDLPDGKRSSMVTDFENLCKTEFQDEFNGLELTFFLGASSQANFPEAHNVVKVHTDDNVADLTSPKALT